MEDIQVSSVECNTWLECYTLYAQRDSWNRLKLSQSEVKGSVLGKVSKKK